MRKLADERGERGAAAFGWTMAGDPNAVRDVATQSEGTAAGVFILFGCAIAILSALGMVEAAENGSRGGVAFATLGQTVGSAMATLAILYLVIKGAVTAGIKAAR